MKIPMLLAIACPLLLQAIDYEVQSENEQIRVSKIKLAAKEEVGLHRDEFPRMVFCIQGGSVQQVFEDGSTNIVEFPTGQTIFLEPSPAGVMHRGINISDNELEILVVELKVKK